MTPREITYSRKQLDKLIKDVFNGDLTPRTLPEDLFEAILGTLSDGVARGFGRMTLTDEIEDLLAHFDRNVGVFSAAKTHQQIHDMTRALFNAQGMKASFSEFKAQAEGIFEQYNVNWLRTEYRTAYNNAFAARQWVEFQQDKDILPVLKYDTANDERVRQEHVELDGIVRHIDDPFWQRYFPPNGWNCRCDVTQHELDELEFTPDDVLATIEPPDTLFNMNAAIDKVIFDPEHPYMSRVAERYHVLRDNDFGLPVPPRPQPRKPKPVVKVAPAGEEHKPKAFDRIAGVKMPAGFWGLFKKEVPLKRTRRRDQAFHRAGEVHVNTSSGRFKTGTDNMLNVMAHEYGHAFHYQHGFVRRGAPVDADFEEFFTRNKKEYFDGRKTEKHDVDFDFFSKRTFRSDEGREYWRNLSKELGLDPNLDDTSELIGTFHDMIGSMTLGEDGFGHDYLYYKRYEGYGARAEVFAMMFESGVHKKNPFLHHFFPSFADELHEMYTTMTNKIKK